MALNKFLEYSFHTLQLHQLYCNITEGNRDSLRLFKKCGFKSTGRKQEWIKTPAEFVDEYMLQLINPGIRKLVKGRMTGSIEIVK